MNANLTLDRCRCTIVIVHHTDLLPRQEWVSRCLVDQISQIAITHNCNSTPFDDTVCPRLAVDQVYRNEPIKLTNLEELHRPNFDVETNFPDYSTPLRWNVITNNLCVYTILFEQILLHALIRRYTNRHRWKITCLGNKPRVSIERLFVNRQTLRWLRVVEFANRWKKETRQR